MSTSTQEPEPENPAAKQGDVAEDPSDTDEDGANPHTDEDQKAYSDLDGNHHTAEDAGRDGGGGLTPFGARLRT